MPHIHKNIINVGRSKFHGSMMSLLFQFSYAVISLQLEVGTIIVRLVVVGFSGLEYKWGDLVGLDKLCDTTLKWLSWMSNKRNCRLRLIAPQVLLKRLIAFIHPYLSIYPYSLLWTIHSLGRFQ